MENKKQLVNTVEELYQDRELYTTSDMFSPPSERLPHVLRFELTEGCTWNSCTYCTGYERIKPREKSEREYEEHLKKVFERIGYRTELAEKLKRIFIGGGNALSVETRKLNRALRYAIDAFAYSTGENPSRISLYGRTTDMTKKGYPLEDIIPYWDLNYLIYWGVESGSDKVLDYVNKGYSKEDILNAGEIIQQTPIRTSVMIMPGLGGIKYYQTHIEETAQVLEKIRPNFLTFMGVNPAPNSVYAKRMQEEQERGENRPLTDYEKAQQMIEIMEKVYLNNEIKIGCFNDKIDAVGHNPLTFGSIKLENNYRKEALIRGLKKLLSKIAERREE